MQKAILAGALKPGAPLSERVFGQMAKISRVPVREALIVLEMKGLVTIVPERGAFVRSFNVEEVRHLYEVREGMEGIATRLASSYMPSETSKQFVDKFRSILDKEKDHDLDMIHRLNIQFHETIIANCDNALLQKLLTDVRNQCRLALIWRLSRSSLPEILQLTHHHLNIAEALAKRSGAQAEKIMRAHIATGRRWYAEPERSLGLADQFLSKI